MALTAAQHPHAPVGTGDRIEAIDAARGLALLGIFCVNILAFSQPFGRFVELTPAEGPPTDRAVHYFIAIFCEGKFYPLFSTLFGVGFAVQMGRARQARRKFWPLALRRLGVLAIVGLAHAYFLWWGDILFIYAVMGLLLLALGRCTPRTLTIIAAVLLFLSTIVSTGFLIYSTVASNTHGAPAAQAPTAEVSPADMPARGAPTAAQEPTPTKPNAKAHGPFLRLMHAFRTQQDLLHDATGRDIAPMSHPIWLQAETEAYQRGPYLDATLFRILTHGIVVIFVFLGFGWTIAAMFLFGAALAKWNAFAPERLHWNKRFAAVGLGVGLPLAAFAVIAPELIGKSAGAVMIFGPLLAISGPMVALGYLGLIQVLLARGIATGFLRTLAAAGRMALTCYLLETALATLVFYHFGLGLFGTLSLPTCVGIVLGIYALLVAFSAAWLKHFRFGPMEWLWRSLTYLKPQPMARDTNPAAL